MKRPGMRKLFPLGILCGNSTIADATLGTFPVGINDSGRIVGYFSTASSYYSFLYSGGTFSTILDPTSMSGGGVLPSRINDSGDREKPSKSEPENKVSGLVNGLPDVRLGRDPRASSSYAEAVPRSGGSGAARCA
jgi:probable HAF family extracellular repeat protein